MKPDSQMQMKPKLRNNVCQIFKERERGWGKNGMIQYLMGTGAFCNIKSYYFRKEAEESP